VLTFVYIYIQVNISLDCIFDKYYITLYYLQYYFAQLIVSSDQSSIWLLIIVFMLLGFLTIVTPCFLSMLPLTISYISYQNNSFNSAFLFIFGLLTSFLSVVKFFNVVSVYAVSSKFSILFSLLMILISLDLMKILSLSKLYSMISSLINLSNNTDNAFQKYLVGLIIGFSSLPCNTSILFIFNFLVTNIANTSSAIVYITAYFFGLILPIVLIFSLNFYSVTLGLLSTFWSLLNTLTGSLLFIGSLLSLLRLLSY